jgi:hypothetical protein
MREKVFCGAVRARITKNKKTQKKMPRRVNNNVVTLKTQLDP